MLYIFLFFSSFCVVLYLTCFTLIFLLRLFENIFDSHTLVLWYFVYIFPRVEPTLVSCYIFPHVECALVLWNFVLYFSACGTCSGIVEYHVIFFRVWNVHWYCGILCDIFPPVSCLYCLRVVLKI